MSHPEERRRQSVSAATIAHRSAAPLFIFSLSLLILLILSHLFLIPRLTTVEIAGEKRGVQELRSYRESLLTELTEKERQRDALVLPMGDTAYGRLVAAKHAEFPLLVLRSSIEQAMRQLIPEREDVVHLENIRYLLDERSAELTGDVRNVGSRSMTVLAQFLESIRDLPFVTDIARPNFIRKEDPAIGPHSPFTLRLQLK